MAIPSEITESEIDDTQSVEFDLDNLVNKFINPIENKRSFVSINPITRPQSKVDVDVISRDLDSAHPNKEAQESRAHAFYRMIGLPVMDKNGNFYNPGFNPLTSTEQRRDNISIANNPSIIVDQQHAAREQNTRNEIGIFQSSPLNATIRAIAMKKIKKFQVMNDQEGFDFLNQRDPQQFSIKARKQFLSKFYELPGGEPLPRFFEQGSHILRPFLVNPVIERTVQSRNRSICAPFLPNINSTKLEQNTILDRPGIEFILRLRLRQQAQDDILNETLFSLDSDVDFESGISAADLRRITFALFDREKIGIEIIEEELFSDFELITINKLVKLIKALIEELHKAIESLDNVIKKINWTPLPGRQGPQNSDEIRISGFVRTKRAGSELERRIKTLEVKSLNAKRRGTISNNEDIANANFALSYFENTEKLFNQELNDAKEEKTELIRQGASALSTIEIITGEVSGLGLIDILAIYTALWAIDLDILVSMLDNSAFQRLVDNNSDLINSNVQQRRDQGTPVFSGIEAIQKFEGQIINILAWADKLFEQKQATPDTAEGGALPQGG